MKKKVKEQSHPHIDGMKESFCCLNCKTLADPFVGCECVYEKLQADIDARFQAQQF